MSQLETMNEYKFLKSISDGKRYKPRNPDLNDQDNEMLLELKKRELINLRSVYYNSGPGILDYWITNKGLQYIEDHKNHNKELALKFIIPLLTFLLGLLSHYLFRLF